MPLDLHHFRECDVPALVEEFVWLCVEEKRKSGAIIHGKGRGTLRAMVHECLQGNKSVSSYQLGGLGNHENWGQTTFYLQID